MMRELRWALLGAAVASAGLLSFTTALSTRPTAAESAEAEIAAVAAELAALKAGLPGRPLTSR